MRAVAIIPITLFALWLWFIFIWPQLRKPNPDRYKNLMQRTAAMERECYGMIVSSSVEWWLQDHGLIKTLPSAGPGCASFRKLPPPNPGMGVARECLRKCRTSELEEIWGDGQMIARWCAKHGTRRDPVPPPPPPIGGLITPTRPSPTKPERR